MSEAIKNETTEMAVASEYSAIANMDFLAEAMNDDCAGLDFKFDRIKIPSGGMTAFEVPSEDGEGSDLVKEIEAVILIRSLPRSVSARLPVHPALISVRRYSR